jgi:hypothetical protein
MAHCFTNDGHHCRKLMTLSLASHGSVSCVTSDCSGGLAHGSVSGGTGYPDTFLVVFLSPARQCRDGNNGNFAQPSPLHTHTHTTHHTPTTHTHTHTHTLSLSLSVSVIVELHVLKISEFPACVFSEIVI